MNLYDFYVFVKNITRNITDGIMDVQIYTDGSCHTQLKIGAWAALIFLENEKIILKGNRRETTHNAMEILAVLEALDFLENQFFAKEKSLDVVKNQTLIFSKIEIVSDSQYVVRILERKEKLRAKDFLTKKKVPIRNVDLVKRLIEKIETLPLILTKIKAHQPKTEEVNYNIEVDHVVRRELRRLVKMEN